MSLNIISSFKSRIFALVVALIISVLTISLAIFYQAIVEVENQRFQNDLNNAKNTVNIYLKERIAQFRNSREAINKAIIEAQVLAEDKETIDSLVDSLFIRTEAEMFMLLDAQRNVLTQRLRISGERPTDGPEVIGQPLDEDLFKHLNDNNIPQIYSHQNSYYQFTIQPIEFLGRVLGWVAYGYELNQSLALELHSDYANQNHVNFVVIDPDRPSDCKLITSSKPDILTAINNGQVVSCDTAEGEFLKATDNILLGKRGSREIQAVIYGARETLISSVSERLEILLVLAGIIIAASVLGVYFIASIISKPVQKLASKARIIAAGNYNEPVEINDTGELGQLASEFNQMQQAVLEREQAIRHQAAHDPLTDLPNRNQLFEKLSDWYQNDHREHGMLLIKIDHVKEINESLGHETGDKVIQIVADRLRKLENTELLSHLRADEFVILIKTQSIAAVMQWIDLITKEMDYPCNTNGMSLHLSAHIGIAMDLDRRYEPGQFLRMADSALQMARKMRVPFKLYDPSLDQEQTERLELMNELRTAIEEDQLILHYQPKLNAVTGQVNKVEALVRWQHPERGMVRPDKFISIAEHSGQINALTNWVMEAAAKQYKIWQDSGLDISIAINISADNLKNESFFDTVLFLTDQYQLDRRALNLEVTESAVVEDPVTAIGLLSQLKKLGFHLSIDDYGTGYSSLAQLKQLPVDELKIDMSFIKKLPHDEDDKIIVKSTIELAHNMGLTVVAEGVETQDGLEWLKANNCDLMQGYFISKPIPGDEFAHWYQTNPFSN